MIQQLLSSFQKRNALTRIAFLFVLLLLSFASLPSRLFAVELTEVEVNNMTVSCIGIDPPASCSEHASPGRKVLNFLTGNQPVSVEAAVGVAVSAPTAATVVAGAAPTFLGTILQSLLNVPNFFSTLWFQFLYFVGLRKRHRPWGRILDSVTGQPIADAAVFLLSDQAGGGKKVVEKSVTDREGRYGFLVSPGQYYFSVNRSGYTFPTQILTSATIYRGASFAIENEKTVTLDLYCDPAEATSPWIIGIRKIALAALWLRLPLLAFGTAISVYGLIKDVIPLNVLLVVIYAVLWVNEIIGFDRSRNTLRIVDERQRPLPFAIFRLLDHKNSNVVATKVTDRHGEAYVLVPSGEYVLQVPTPKNPQGSMAEVKLPRGVAARNMTVSIEY